MKILKRWWVRVLLSVFAIGVLSEFLSIITGQNQGFHPLINLLLFIFFYLGSSIVYGFYLRQKDKRDNHL